jgi:hypothetical protein
VCTVLNASADVIADDQGGIYVSVFPQSRIDTIPHAGRQNCGLHESHWPHELN